MPTITPTPLGLKQFFSTLLADYLGTYTYTNGYVEPAIHVGNPPNSVVATGLEVILPMLPDRDSNLIAATRYQEDLYDIYLIQRSGANHIPAAVEAITSYCWKSRGFYIPQIEPNISYVCYNLKISVIQLVESVASVG